MDLKRFQQILQLLDKESDLLESGEFGQGLWPVDVELGQLMYWLIRLKGLKRGIEVGAGVGYSTLWIAQALQENEGKLLTLEYFPPKVAQLEKHLEAFFGKNYQDFIDLIPAGFDQAVSHFGKEKFDFVFFDQRKSDYLPHLQKLLPKLRRGAFICADNVDSHEKASASYLKFVRQDQRFESITVSEGAGLSISLFLGKS